MEDAKIEKVDLNGFDIERFRLVRREDWLEFSGVVRNTTGRAWARVDFAVELYDQEDYVTDVCHIFVGRIQDGATRAFKDELQETSAIKEVRIHFEEGEPLA